MLLLQTLQDAGLETKRKGVFQEDESALRCIKIIRIESVSGE
jgi:hypothetical protein